MAKVPSRLRRDLSRRVQKEMSALLLRQSQYVAAQLRAHTITASSLSTLPPDYLDPNDAENELADILAPILRDAAQLSGAAITTSLRARPYSHNPTLDSTLNQRARTVAHDINSTTLTDLSRLIRNSEDDDEAADEVESYGQRESRPSLIALMEVGFAIAAGTRAAATQAAKEKEKSPVKSWLLSPDHAEHDWCDDYAAFSPIPLDAEWDDGDPPAHIGCNCEMEVDLMPEKGEGINAGAGVCEGVVAQRPRKPQGPLSFPLLVGEGRPEIIANVITVSGPQIITAAADGEGWHAVALVEGVTWQGREFAPGSISTRPLTLPLMYMTENGQGGHEGARLCGAILTASRDDKSRIITTGIYDDGEDGQEAARLGTPDSSGVQMLRWVSSDIEVVDYEEVYDPNTDEIWFRCTNGNLMGQTMCPFPWYASCVIAPQSIPLPDAIEQGEAMAGELAVGNSGVGGNRQGANSGPTGTPLAIAACANWSDDNLPPIQYFSNPNLTRPTLPTIDENGRVYGHIARWDIPHIGYQGQQRYAPKSQSNYAYFMTGQTRAVDENGTPTEIRTGRLVLNTTHPDDPNLPYNLASHHYDHTGACVADIIVGEDEIGIWYSGAVRQGVNETQYRVLSSSGAVSGDWRPIGNDLEMVGLLVVNAPGFPIGALAASLTAAAISIPTLQSKCAVQGGKVMSLVGAGAPASAPTQHHLGFELERLTQRMERLEGPGLRAGVRDMATRLGVEV